MSEEPNTSVRMFHVETNFQRLARRPGGVPKERALKQADKEIETIKPEVLSWMRGQVAILDLAVNEIKADPASMEKIARAYEISTQVRDIGTTLGFPLLTFIVGNLSEILDTLRYGAPCCEDIITCHQLSMLLSLSDEYRRMDPDNLPELKAGLERVLEIANRRNPAEQIVGRDKKELQ